MHGLPEQQETLCLLENEYAARCGGKSRKRQTSVNDDVASNAFCSKTTDISNIFLNERMVSVQLIIHNVWTEVRK